MWLTSVQDEEERLETEHNVLFQVFGGRLVLAPIAYPDRILDCGYGTGQWAVAMAQMYSDCQVGATQEPSSCRLHSNGSIPLFTSMTVA